MKPAFLTVLLWIIALSQDCLAYERTFIVANTGSSIVLSNSLVLSSNEVFEVTYSSKSGAGTPSLTIEKDGVSISYAGAGTGWPPNGLRFVGPAYVAFTVATYSPGNDTKGIITFKIEPESFPPGQTLIVPQGTGAIVHMESSTNLLSWKNEWTQTFTNSPDHRFFRLTAERTP